MSIFPFSILFLNRRVLITGNSRIPDVIRPKAILSVCVLLSNAKSFIISVRCLNNSIPEPIKSLDNTYVTDGVIVILTGPLSLDEP